MMGDTDKPDSGRKNGHSAEQNGHSGDNTGGSEGDTKDLVLPKNGLTTDTDVRSTTSSSSSTGLSGSGSGSSSTAANGRAAESGRPRAVGSDCSEVASGYSTSEKSVSAASSSQQVVTCTKASYVKRGHGMAMHRDLPPIPNGTGR